MADPLVSVPYKVSIMEVTREESIDGCPVTLLVAGTFRIRICAGHRPSPLRSDIQLPTPLCAMPNPHSSRPDDSFGVFIAGVSKSGITSQQQSIWGTATATGRVFIRRAKAPLRHGGFKAKSDKGGRGQHEICLLNGRHHDAAAGFERHRSADER